MSVREFTNLVIDERATEIKIFDNEKQKDIFFGSVADLSDNILDSEIGSWDIEDNTICLNVEIRRI